MSQHHNKMPGGPAFGATVLTGVLLSVSMLTSPDCTAEHVANYNMAAPGHLTQHVWLAMEWSTHVEGVQHAGGVGDGGEVDEGEAPRLPRELVIHDAHIQRGCDGLHCGCNGFRSVAKKKGVLSMTKARRVDSRLPSGRVRSMATHQTQCSCRD